MGVRVAGINEKEDVLSFFPEASTVPLLAHETIAVGLGMCSRVSRVNG